MGSRLLEYIGPKASRKTFKWLKTKKVEVKLEQSVNLNSFTDENRTYQTSLGETIEVDTHFLWIGKPLSSAWLRETLLKDEMDANGRIQVDDYMRVKGHNNIFAIGDIGCVQLYRFNLRLAKGTGFAVFITQNFNGRPLVKEKWWHCPPLITIPITTKAVKRKTEGLPTCNNLTY